MPEFHAEPYIYLPAVTHSSALVAWGAFYFKVTSQGRMKLVRPQDLEHVHPPRKDTIGARSAPYGPDGQYGRYLSYRLVIRPVGWLMCAGVFGVRKPGAPGQQAAR